MLYPNKGLSLFEQRKYKDAQNIYEALFIIDYNCIKSDCNEYTAKVQKCKSRYLEYHYTKGIEFIRKGQRERAIKEFNFVLATDLNYKDTAQKKQESIHKLENVELKRRRYNSHLKNGNKLFNQNNYLAAKKQFEEANQYALALGSSDYQQKCQEKIKDCFNKYKEYHYNWTLDKIVFP